eukprot:370647_1
MQRPLMQIMVLQIVVIILYIYPLFGANTIQCHSESICQCPQNDTCIVQCSGGGSCRCSKIECPLNYPCYIQCHAGESCQFSNFISSSNGNLCNIECYGGESCKSSHINCPLNSNNQCVNTTISSSEIVSVSSTDKNITCTPSPTNAPIVPPNMIYCGVEEICECPNDKECEILCGGGNSCHCNSIICPLDYNCTISCGGGNSCHNVSINCPINKGVSCQLECGGGGSCNGVYVNSNNITSFSLDSWRCGDGQCQFGITSQNPYEYFDGCVSVTPSKYPTVIPSKYPTQQMMFILLMHLQQEILMLFLVIYLQVYVHYYHLIHLQCFQVL